MKITTELPAEITLIRDAIHLAGISQVKLAEQTAISRPWTNEILTGRREASILVLCRMAQLAGIPSSKMRAAGRADVAALLDATPSTPLHEAPTRQLLDELERRLNLAAETAAQ